MSDQKSFHTWQEIALMSVLTFRATCHYNKSPVHRHTDI